MAEALVFARNNTHPVAAKDQRGCWKRGMVVVVKPDGHQWGAEETPVGKTAAERKFVLFKFPGVSVARVEKYVGQLLDVDNRTVLRRCRWQVIWDELPLAARQKLIQDGEVSIGPVPPNDYTWAQVKGFFHDFLSGLRETEDL